MTEILYAGVARKVINPMLGIKKIGMRLFGDPIQAIESDLTATAIVIANSSAKVALIACDLCGIPASVVSEVRQRISAAIDIPTSHVLVNESHTHSCPAFPTYTRDIPEQIRLKQRYKDSFMDWVVEAATNANQQLQPVRIGAGWGEARIGIYRRETGPDGRDVLGEVPDAPTDPAVGVIRVDDLDGRPVATLFSYGCHPVTIGPRSMVASSDFPGAAREVIEHVLGGMAIFFQACGGNINPIGGIGYEVDCRDTRNRVGVILGGEVLKVAANIRTHVRPGPRTPLGTIPNILFTPLIPVEDEPTAIVKAVDETVKLRFVELPTLAEAEAIQTKWRQTLADRQAGDAREWEIALAVRYCRWADNLVDAVRDGNPTAEIRIQAIRINNIVLATISAEAFFETGFAIKAQSAFEHTQVLGYSNGLTCYLPRAEDFPANGWKLDQPYALPDLMFQAAGLSVAIHPESEQVVVERTLKLIDALV